MTAIRLGSFLMLGALAAAQSFSSPKVIEPKLPVVERDACPRAVVLHVKLEKEVQMYSSWQEKRALVGTLKACWLVINADFAPCTLACAHQRRKKTGEVHPS